VPRDRASGGAIVSAVLRVVALAAVLTVASAGCAKEVVDPISAEVDFGDPKSVLGAVFYAARSGDPAPLPGLCMVGVSEPSVVRLCELRTGTPEWTSFRTAFAGARLNGEPRVHEDHTSLNFVFGEDVTHSETMELARRAGRWYLLRF
jgi:hypothetical protein